MAEAGIRALIIDDEPPARALIRRMLRDTPDLEIVGECANGQEAFAALQQQQPDLIFLDIQMPEMDGFALLEALEGKQTPAVIFVTAFDRYAVRAFDVAAVDYLLKPFDHDRMEKALERVRQDLRDRNSEHRSHRMLELLTQIQARTEYLERFVIRNNGRVVLVRAEEVDWVESAGNYLLLHAGKSAHMIRDTMQNLERRLDPNRFLRIHRSAIVNLDSIAELNLQSSDDPVVVMKDGNRLPLSRRYREKVSRALGTNI